MSNEAKRPRRRTGENRERLLSSALILFGDYGFQGTTTELIGRHADVPQPHLYANFASKQQLFLSSVESVVDQAIERAPELPCDEHCRLIYQAFAVSRAEELSEQLTGRLESLRHAYTPAGLACVLHRAAVSLLRTQ